MSEENSFYFIYESGEGDTYEISYKEDECHNVFMED
jgi:hypothetical protein